MFRFSLSHSLIAKPYNTNFISNFKSTLKYSFKPFSTGSTSKEAKKKDTKLHTIFLALFPVLSFGLGTWQLARLRWKLKLIEEYEDRLSIPPINLPKRIKWLYLKSETFFF